MKQKVIILGSNPITRLSLILSIGEAMDCEITVVDMVHSLSKKQRKPVDCYSKYVSRCLYAQKYQAEALCDLLSPLQNWAATMWTSTSFAGAQ